MYLSEIVALCGGKTDGDGACNIPYPNDRIIYRGGLSRNSGDGTCSGPATCTNCKLGFYPQNGGTDGYCRSNIFLFKQIILANIWKLEQVLKTFDWKKHIKIRIYRNISVHLPSLVFIYI